MSHHKENWCETYQNCRYVKLLVFGLEVGSKVIWKVEIHLIDIY